MKIAMANDHAGTRMKYEIKALLENMGHEVVDFGTYDENAADLPDYVYPAALAVARGECDRGIFVDGVGYGSAMIANKICGIYAAVCQDPLCAALSRQRYERALPRGQNYRHPHLHGDREDLDDDRRLHGGEICEEGREGKGYQRPALCSGKIKERPVFTAP